MIDRTTRLTKHEIAAERCELERVPCVCSQSDLLRFGCACDASTTPTTETRSTGAQEATQRARRARKDRT